MTNLRLPEDGRVVMERRCIFEGELLNFSSLVAEVAPV